MLHQFMQWGEVSETWSLWWFAPNWQDEVPAPEMRIDHGVSGGLLAPKWGERGKKKREKRHPGGAPPGAQPPPPPAKVFFPVPPSGRPPPGGKGNQSPAWARASGE